LSVVLAVLAMPLAGPFARAQAVPAAPDPVEVQTRGPVHEAFAQPVDPNAQPEPLVNTQPPDAVPEEPPEQRPEGANVQWLPGYWAWDADRHEFLWVSGVYRDAPPGTTFEPGYWTQEGEAWRWVPGYWTAASQAQQSYYPPPPASVEVGPSLPAPDDNSVYAPGYWVYQETRYVWRPGCWLAARSGMVWVPPHYVWTPAGYVFVPGYWDYPLERRGLLFAPVIFRRPLWADPAYRYRPAYVVECRPLLESLFVGPVATHYYYGDYFAAAGRRGGFQLWIDFGPRRFDPLYSYYRFEHRRDPAWLPALQRVYADRVAGRAPLPPRTLVQQTTARQTLVTPLARLGPQTMRLTTVTAPQLQVQRTTIQQTRQAVVARRQLETSTAGRTTQRTAVQTLPRAGVRTQVRSTTTQVQTVPTPAGPVRSSTTVRKTQTRAVLPAATGPVVVQQKTAVTKQSAVKLPPPRSAPARVAPAQPSRPAAPKTSLAEPRVRQVAHTSPAATTSRTAVRASVSHPAAAGGRGHSNERKR
jgi:hypothetical protein